MTFTNSISIIIGTLSIVNKSIQKKRNFSAMIVIPSKKLLSTNKIHHSHLSSIPKKSTITSENSIKESTIHSLSTTPSFSKDSIVSEPDLSKQVANLSKDPQISSQYLEELKIRSMEEAAKTLGKSLPSDPSFPHRSWLINQISKIVNSEEKAPLKHEFIFENTREAAKFNTKLIKHSNYDFVQACTKQKDSILYPGTEFRKVTHLEQLLSKHEDWIELKSIIQNGCDYKMSPQVDEKTRQSDLSAMIKRGNHKSASSKNAKLILQKAFDKEISRGYLLPITLESTSKIKNLSVIPMGIAHQLSIDEKGNRIPKSRVTHDASFPSPSGDSVNSKVIDELLVDCIYGQCLRRVIHNLHQMRYTYPEKKIYMSKYDLDAAYRRLHVSLSQALQCTTIIDKIAYIPLRLPFGVKSGPSLYSTMSETIFDLTNDILNDKTWNENELVSPITNKLSKPLLMPDNIPFAKVERLGVYVPPRFSFCDGYIDDFLSAGIELENHVMRSQRAPPLAVYSVFRPIHKDEPITRDDPIAIKKLLGEGQPSEQKVMLGWKLCTRQSRIFLPMDKCKSWTMEIENLLTNMTTTEKEMESTVGRLNHVGFIIPNARYFLNRLRHLLFRCQKYGKQVIKRWEADDLVLWKSFLNQASYTGISFNNICHTVHTNTILTDASEAGLGGFNPKTGRAWRFKLPKWMETSLHINILEFIACTIGIWLEVLEMKKSNKKFIKIRALTDNSSAVGWLYKSNFNPTTHGPHDVVARKLASILLESETSITSQHTPGKTNIVADSLSRDFHLPVNHLTFILKTLYPSQAPTNLTILETLPNEITSWISSLKDSSINHSAPPGNPDPSKTGTFFDGASSWKDVVSKTNLLMNLHKNKKSNCCQASQSVLEEMNLAKLTKVDSPDLPSPPPSATYVRPFGRTFGVTRL